MLFQSQDLPLALNSVFGRSAAARAAAALASMSSPQVLHGDELGEVLALALVPCLAGTDLPLTAFSITEPGESPQWFDLASDEARQAWPCATVASGLAATLGLSPSQSPRQPEWSLVDVAHTEGSPPCAEVSLGFEDGTLWYATYGVGMEAAPMVSIHRIASLVLVGRLMREGVEPRASWIGQGLPADCQASARAISFLLGVDSPASFTAH